MHVVVDSVVHRLDVPYDIGGRWGPEGLGFFRGLHLLAFSVARNTSPSLHRAVMVMGSLCESRGTQGSADVVQ